MSKPEPRWDIDYADGQQMEAWVQDIADALKQGAVEVKYDRKAHGTGNLYVEYECCKRGTWCKSGIATSLAPVWVFVIVEREVALVIAADTLKRLGRAAIKAGMKAEETDGKYPTRGALVRIADMRSFCRRAQTA